MSDQDAPPLPPCSATSTRQPIMIVIILALLPLPLPFLFALLWQQIYRGESVLEGQLLQQCADFDCVKQGLLNWELLGWLFILGPSILAALLPLFGGVIGLWRARRHATSPKRRALFRASVTFGIVWAILFSCILGAILWITATVGISN